MRNKLFIVILISLIVFVIPSLIGLLYERKTTEILVSEWITIRPPGEVSALLEQGNIIWAGGRDGVFAVHRLSGEVLYKLEDEKPFRYVRALLLDENGRLLIGHSSGVTFYDGKNFITYSQEDGLPASSVTCLLLDQHNNLWVGTFNGAARLENGRLISFTEDDGLIVNMVNVIFEDSGGGLWFGSSVAPRGGLSYLKNDQWQYFTTAEGLPHNNINILAEDAAGGIWVGTGFYTQGGAARLIAADGENWLVEKTFTVKDGLPGDKVRSIYHDRYSNLWFGTEYHGLAKVSGDNVELFSIQQGLADLEVKVFLEDSSGNLWLGTHNGINFIGQGLWEMPVKGK